MASLIYEVMFMYKKEEFTEEESGLIKCVLLEDEDLVRSWVIVVLLL